MTTYRIVRLGRPSRTALLRSRSFGCHQRSRRLGDKRKLGKQNSVLIVLSPQAKVHRLVKSKVPQARNSKMSVQRCMEQGNHAAVVSKQGVD